MSRPFRVMHQCENCGEPIREGEMHYRIGARRFCQYCVQVDFADFLNDIELDYMFNDPLGQLEGIGIYSKEKEFIQRRQVNEI